MASKRRAVASTKKKTAGRRDSATPPKPAQLACTLAGASGVRVAVASSGLERLSMEWSYLVRNRHRWAESPSEVERLSRRAAADLKSLGVEEAQVRALAACPVVEVQVPFRSEESSWAARIFPWEFVLSRATRMLPDRHPDFVVVRYLQREGGFARKPPRLRSLLSVSSAPGAFRDSYSFADEHALLADTFGAAPSDASGVFRKLENPTANELHKFAASFSAVHISGIDAQLGAELLSRGERNAPPPRAASRLRDGLYLMGEGGREELVDAERLAQALAPSGSAPDLVTFNVYGSAARMASLCVAHGAGAAVGFQDQFDDAQSERFFAELYKQWANGNALIDCFRGAFSAMREQKDVRLGSGVVLWSAKSLLEREQQRKAIATARAPTSGADIRAHLKVRVELPETLNYAKLHNGERLFNRLSLYNHSNQKVRDVQLEVVLRVGSEQYSYQHRLDLEHAVVSLEHKVRIALSWSVMRELTESVQTTILVRALHEGHVFYEDTFAVALLPVNEWVDDENSGPWLPSLVLPRDPVVPEIINCARRYLRVLADDAHVGFDGYQQITMSEDDELDEEQAWIVDVQVRAIWYALLHDYGLGYINPPPTFTANSQRLRRPSEILQGRHGTCIDLALLLAACLEYIGINPVLFLIDGHAFPGYFRMDMTLAKVHLGADLAREAVETMQARTRPWSSGREYWQELQGRIERGHIVPIETVALTALQSFDIAVEQGCENLRNEAEFHTMLDVLKAREQRVTPLPL